MQLSGVSSSTRATCRPRGKLGNMAKSIVVRVLVVSKLLRKEFRASSRTGSLGRAVTVSMIRIYT